MLNRMVSIVCDCVLHEPITVKGRYSVGDFFYRKDDICDRTLVIHLAFLSMGKPKQFKYIAIHIYIVVDLVYFLLTLSMQFSNRLRRPESKH